VLLHERAHIVRRDHWANLIARIVGVFFGLHPVAAFALHRIERERERACDDWVVASTGDARPYAASLTRVFELTRRGTQPDLASGFMGSRLGGRIEELLTQGRQFTRRISIAMVAAIVPIVILGLRAPSMVAYAQQRPEPVAQVAQATPTQPGAPAKPVTPAKPAPAKGEASAVTDRLEALLARLEEMLDRMNPQGPDRDVATLRQLTMEKNLAAQAAALQAAQDQTRARQAEMQAMEQQVRAQQRDLEKQLLEVERAMQELKAKQQANPQNR
jgi:hypothetical protein